MSNFAFLQSEWSTLFGAASKAEGMANTDARTSCFYARRTLELAVDWLYKHDPALRLPYQDHLSALIHEPTFKATAGDAVFTKAKLIKDLGNMAVHSTRIVLRTDAVTATRELFHFCYWLARTYGQRARPAPDLRFDAALIPLPPAPSAVSADPAQSIEQLQELETQLKASDEKLSVLLPAKAALDDELQQLRLEVAAAKQANTTQPDTHDYSESETRDYFIDLLLKEAGWQLDVKNFEVPVSGMPNKQGVGSHVGETRLKLGDPLDDAQLRDELAGFLDQQVAARTWTTLSCDPGANGWSASPSWNPGTSSTTMHTPN
jgi:type I restriction enzyme R subunit